MNEQGWFAKFLKIFGFVYFAINLLLFGVLCIMSFHAQMKFARFSGPWMLLIFPGIGILSGYWMRQLKFNWWRNIVIFISLVCAAGFIFVVVAVIPSFENFKQKKHEQMTQPKEPLAPNVQRFFMSVYSNDVESVKQKLEQGINVNAINEMKQTALHVTQNKAIANLLIAHGADLNAKDDMGMPPMFNKELPIAKMLVEAGADIHATSEKGNSIVMWYTYSGYLDGIKYFIKKGVDVNHVNEDGQTAYDIAEAFEKREVLEYLKSIGAKSGKKL